MKRNRIRLFCVSLIVLPGVLWLLYIGAYGVNVAIYDQWTFVPLIDKWETGNLTISDLAALYNDHKPFFPRLIMLSLADLTHYNNLAEMYFGWLLVCLSCLLLFLIYKKHFEPGESSLLKFIPISWLIFSLGPYEHITYGWGFATFLCVLGLLAMIYFLEESKSLDLCLLFSAICAFVASFSFANGLLVWIVGLFQILLSKSEKRVRMGGAWGLAWISTYTLYFHDYTKPAYHPSLFYFLKYPLDSGIFLLMNIGAPLSVGMISAVPVGLILIILSLHVLKVSIKRERVAYNAKWLSLILFSILSSLILVVGRAGGGYDYAVASRFTTFTLLGLAGVYLLMTNSQERIKKDRTKYVLYGAMLCLMCLGLAQTYIKAMIEGKASRDFRKKVAYYLCSYRFQPIETDYFDTIYPLPNEVRNGVKILQKHGMNIFAQNSLNINQLTLKQGETLFSIDALQGQTFHQQNVLTITKKQKDDLIIFEGWAIDMEAKQKAGGVFINLNDKVQIPTVYGLDRKDVADHFKNKDYRYSGFWGSCSSSFLMEGINALSIKVVTRDKKEYYTPKEKKVFRVIQD